MPRLRGVAFAQELYWGFLAEFSMVNAWDFGPDLYLNGLDYHN